MRRRWLELLGALCIVVALAMRGQAAIPQLEVNGREYYGTVVSDNGEVYAALDVVGPLLLGPQFRLEVFDVTLRRCTFTFVPSGASAPQKVEVFGCVKRGAAVYAPLRPLLRQVGGSYQMDVANNLVSVAYPPATAVVPTPTPAPTPTRPQPTPTPSAARYDCSPKPQITPAQTGAIRE